MLTGVSGLDFSWRPGEVVTMSEEDAAKWADGVRGELVDAPAPEPTRAERVAAAAEEVKPERAVPKSRGGGRAAKPETRD
jgi:hypothetical protein